MFKAWSLAPGATEKCWVLRMLTWQRVNSLTPESWVGSGELDQGEGCRVCL